MRSQLSNFLGLPSDNGLHNLSGETQSRASQAVDNARAGNGPFSNNISGETQSRLSQLYDQAGSRDRPSQNNISGETQSRGSQIYDNIRAGNGPFQPWSNWNIHNNAVAIRNNFNNYNIFTGGWYRRYPGAWYPAGWAFGGPWVYAPWATLWPWLGYPATQPVYYDYGTNVVNQNNTIYVNGQDVGTPAQYYQQAQNIAQTGATADAGSSQQWMPLGVFSISDAGQTKSNLVIQLAVDKQDIIRGNLTNTMTDTNLVVHGAVDIKTERAAWTIGDDTKTVYETGIYNLTKAQTPVLIHYGNDQTEQALLVRLEQKDQSPSGQAGAAAGAASSDGR